MREDSPRIPLAGTMLVDAGAGHPVDLGEVCGPGVTVLSLIRHRF